EARMDTAHRDEAVGRGRAVFRDVLVHARREAHEVWARVVDEHGALDAVRVQAPQEVRRAAVDLLDLVEVRAPAADDLEHLGLELPPRLDVDVRVGDGHAGMLRGAASTTMSPRRPTGSVTASASPGRKPGTPRTRGRSAPRSRGRADRTTAGSSSPRPGSRRSGASGPRVRTRPRPSLPGAGGGSRGRSGRAWR